MGHRLLRPHDREKVKDRWTSEEERGEKGTGLMGTHLVLTHPLCDNCIKPFKVAEFP